MTGTTHEVDPLDAAAAEAAATAYDELRRGTMYDPLIEEIRVGLQQTEAKKFERALVKLGSLAGVTSSVGDGGATARPDASWDFAGVFWVTWEAKSEADPAGEVDVSSIDQTNRHLRSMSDRLGQPIPSGSVSILVTAQSRFHPAASAVAEGHSHWVDIKFVQNLASKFDRAWRTIKTSLAPDSEAERKRQVILEVFRTEGALPTQWLSSVRRIRPDDVE